MLWICNITFVLKGAEAQNPRTLFSAKKKHKGSKTPHANSYCGEEAEQQCWSLKSPAEGTAQRVELSDVSLTRGCHRARADPRGSFSTEMAETTALNMGLLLQPQHLQKQHQSNPLHLVLAISVCLRFSGLGFFFCEVVFRFGLGSSEQRWLNRASPEIRLESPMFTRAVRPRTQSMAHQLKANISPIQSFTELWSTIPSSPPNKLCAQMRCAACWG